MNPPAVPDVRAIANRPVPMPRGAVGRRAVSALSVAVLLALGALVLLRRPVAVTPQPAPEASVGITGADAGPSSGRDPSEPGAMATAGTVAGAVQGGAARPWWAELSEPEAAVRREDFGWMAAQPGAFPEFGEIVRQLGDAGVPEEIVKMEAREVLGALLQRRQSMLTAGELAGTAAGESSEGMAEADRLLAAKFAGKAAEAEAEVHARLGSMGIPRESPVAARILQLAPTTPLRPLGHRPPPWSPR